MSRILHLVNMVQRYHKSKGVREYRQEEPPLGSLAATPHLEESASHHYHGERIPCHSRVASVRRLVHKSLLG